MSSTPWFLSLLERETTPIVPVCFPGRTSSNLIKLKKIGLLLKKMGWSGGAMVLGKLPEPGRPTNSD